MCGCSLPASVLAALSSLAENTGDHFVLGVGRSVKWLYSSDIRQEGRTF